MNVGFAAAMQIFLQSGGTTSTLSVDADLTVTELHHLVEDHEFIPAGACAGHARARCARASSPAISSPPPPRPRDRVCHAPVCLSLCATPR